jgi:hypothetical protein
MQKDSFLKIEIAVVVHIAQNDLPGKVRPSFNTCLYDIAETTTERTGAIVESHLNRSVSINPVRQSQQIQIAVDIAKHRFFPENNWYHSHSPRAGNYPGLYPQSLR